MYGRFGIRKWNQGLEFGRPLNAINERNVGTAVFDVYNSETNPEGTRPGVAWLIRNTTSMPGGVGVDIDVKDASFLRVRDITLGYNVDKTNLGVVGKVVSQIRFYFNTQNPFIFTKYPIIDPEIITGGGQSSRVSFPQSRTYSFGIKATL